LAALRDTRFPPVRLEELADLRFQVSVVYSTEDISSHDQLDPQRYGVIMSATDGRHSILLPGIKEITTKEEQLRLVRMKGGIRPNETVKLRRFQVDCFDEPA